MSGRSAYILGFDEISIGDIPRVGGKNAALGEMYRELAGTGVRVPPGFAVTAAGYRRLLEHNGLDRRIPELLAGLDTADVANLQERGRRVREAILAATLPDDLERAIRGAYRALSGSSTTPLDVAVRSSATAEDLPDASFAGQQETYLNVQGEEPVLDACRRCYASLFTDRAISYRVDKGFDHFQVALSIGIQQMVRSDLAASGVMFTLDTETGFRDVVLINAAYGLGENVVQGIVNPDEFCIFKPTLRQGRRPIVRRRLGTKETRLEYDTGGGRMTRNVPVPVVDRSRFAIDDDDVLQLARWAMLIEGHFSRKRGAAVPMDIEWAKDGRTGDLFILQARPETVQSLHTKDVLEIHHLRQRGSVLVKGRAVGDRIAAGPVRRIRSTAELATFQKGEVLVSDRTDPDWEPTMKLASAIVSRELGLPAVIGTENATELLRDGQLVTVCCAEGETGRVYAGRLPFEVERVELKSLARPRTRIMLNVGNPDEAFRLSLLPNDGVGLARLEFIISSAIRIHPLALVHFDRVEDAAARAEIERLTASYQDKPQFFVDKLAEGVATIAAAFYPKDVIVRLSDFKTNEYANLVGGRPFEPLEENPMLGFRGASRYYDPRYREGFDLECRAVRKVREEMGLKNVKLMIPFCRTIEEAERVIAVLRENELAPGKDGLELYVMCEIPSNVILAKEFAELFDGFSIGSNDLTQLLLGVDRDSEIVAHVFDERNPAVMRMIAQVIQVAHQSRRKIGICGQAPSDYPEFAEFLVREHIDSLSLNPDAVLSTTVKVLEVEQRLQTS